MDADLERFMAAIAWEQANAAEEIVCDYVETLIERFANLVLTMEGGDRGRALSMLNEAGGGSVLVARLSWPPISRTLLGRAPDGSWPGDMSPTPERIVPRMPPLMRCVGWLETDLGKRGWRPHEVLATSRLAEAFALLGTCGPDVEDFVSLCTRVIVPLRAPDGVLGSWSSDEWIGCTVLVNHDNIQHPALLAEQLVHEAVHHCQAMVESRKPFIIRPELANRSERYPSPWTGAPLTAKSLIGACAVWFSIVHFWLRAQDHVDAAIVEAGKHRAIRGFEGSELQRYLADFRWALDADVPDLVSAMRDNLLGKQRQLPRPRA